MQKQLEKRIIEVEKTKQLQQEERRKAVEAVEKQVSVRRVCFCVVRQHVERVCLSVCSFLSCPVQVGELQRSLKASQTEQQDALERAAASRTMEQKAVQDSLLQVRGLFAL